MVGDSGAVFVRRPPGRKPHASPAQFWSLLIMPLQPPVFPVRLTYALVGRASLAEAGRGSRIRGALKSPA
jgi:hypothetical protein